MLRLTSLALILCAVSACSSEDNDSRPSGSQPEPTQSLPDGAVKELQQSLDDVIGAQVSPGVSVMVDRPGYRTWSGSAGVADIETGATLTAAHRFRAGSMLKMSVAAAVLEVVEDGKLSLDDTLPRVLPNDVSARIPGASAITVEMLLNHTSGIAEFDDPAFDLLVAQDPTRIWTFDDELNRALSFPPVFAPGAGWSYSNTDYILLGAILQQATGKPWRQVVREQVFARAGLRHTSLPEEGNPLCDGCARGYLPMEDVLVDVTEVDPSMAGAAGGDAMITTPDDIATMLRALVTGKLFDDPQTFELMSDFVDAADPQLAQTGYGLGLMRFQIGETQFIGHLGGTAGFHSFAMYQPDSDAIVSGYMNVNGDFGAFILPFLDAVGRTMGTPE